MSKDELMQIILDYKSDLEAALDEFDGTDFIGLAKLVQKHNAIVSLLNKIECAEKQTEFLIGLVGGKND